MGDNKEVDSSDSSVSDNSTTDYQQINANMNQKMILITKKLNSMEKR